MDGLATERVERLADAGSEDLEHVGDAGLAVRGDPRAEEPARDLLAAHGAPLLATTLIDPRERESAPLNDPHEIRERFQHQLDAVIGAGPCPDQPTTVIDLTAMGTGGDAVLVRQGRGDASVFGL